jgi:hypothetical protein
MKTLLEWFAEYGSLMNISEVEKKIGCPKNTLRKYLKGERGISNKWEISVINLLSEMSWIERSEIEAKKAFIEDGVKIMLSGERIKTDKTIGSGKKLPFKIFEEIPPVIDMSTVDVTTGEIKEKLVSVRLAWSFNRWEGEYNPIESWISSNGELFEVKKIFGNITKYTYVDNIEDARRIVHAKNPLLVELSK